MLIPYDKRITDKFPELYEHISNNYLQNIVAYIINSNTRKSVIVKSWLKEQVSNPTPELTDALKYIKGNNYDEIMISTLRFVKATVTYVGDPKTWKATEYWQTAQETLTLKTGDCEDGAILIYVLARLSGVPANRLLVLCGDVKGGGHAWVGYKPLEYPLNFVFLDWCYWYKKESIDLRNKFYINDNLIKEYTNVGQPISSSYYKIWFGVNEVSNVKNYKYIVGRNNK